MWLPRELRTGEGRFGSFGLVDGKPLHIQWINNKVLLYSTGNNIQCPVIKYSDKNIKKNVYMSHFAIQQKLIQHCKSTILQCKVK